MKSSNNIQETEQVELTKAEHIELTKTNLENKGLFNNLIKFFASIGGKLKRKNLITGEISKFEEFVKAVDPKDPMYESVKKVAELCDKAIDFAREKLMLDSKLQVLNSEIQEIAYYENLTEEDIVHLKDLVDRYMGLSRDRNVMRNQIASFDKAIERMDKLEEDAKYVLENVRDAEKKQRYFKNDLRHIEGEKVALNYERESLLNAKIFVQKFSVSLVILFFIVASSIAIFTLVTRANMFVPMFILVFMLMIIVPGMYYIKNRINRELKLNLRKQKKVSELFNKKSVVYVHYTNFLNFVYKKYQVQNAEKLDQNIKDYDHYRHILTRYDAIGKSLKNTEDQIDFFIREHGIKNTAATIEAFAKTMDIEDKKRYYHELKKEQERLLSRNKELEEKHNNVWNDLVVLNEEDKKSQVIDFIIQRYIEEVGKLATTVKYDEPLLESPFESKENEKLTLSTPSNIAKSSKSLNMDFDVTAP